MFLQVICSNLMSFEGLLRSFPGYDDVKLEHWHFLQEQSFVLHASFKNCTEDKMTGWPSLSQTNWPTPGAHFPSSSRIFPVWWALGKILSDPTANRPQIWSQYPISSPVSPPELMRPLGAKERGACYLAVCLAVSDCALQTMGTQRVVSSIEAEAELVFD